MMLTDFIYLIQWWVVLFLLGLTFLPLSSLIFKDFFDRGYIFAKILGLLAVSYLSWLLGSLHLLPFSTTSLYLIIAVLMAINIFVLFKKNVFPLILNTRYLILVEELLFIACLISWAFVRSHEPSIHGLEKFMDFGFINSILRSDYFPPKDLWLTPETINYYYFGHLSAAVLIKLAGISSIIGYNLVLATLFALCFTASFSLSANLLKIENLKLKIISGLLSAFLVTLAGNLHTIYLFFATYAPADNPTPFWNLPLQLNFAEYWYPNATRFIVNTIHEFPLYSFVVADLHGHLLNLPYVLLFIALLLVIFSKPLIHNTYYLILGLLLGVFLMTNVLDGPIYLLVLSVVLLFQVRSLRLVTCYLLLVTFVAIATTLPYWLSFTPFSSGIGVLCAPEFLTNIGKLGPFLFEADHCQRSPVWMLLILWGLPLSLALGFFRYVILRAKPEGYNLTIPFTPFRVTPTDLLVLSLILASLFLILIPEFFYAKDIYPAHYRANTVFKFGYQAFIILGLISGYILVRLHTLPKRIYLLLVPCYLLLTLAAAYPFFAINSYYGALKNYQGLDGLQYLSVSYLTDYQAILWARENIAGQPVILEAVGESYTDFARVSSNTGLPTVLGWPVHEWLWRGSYDIPSPRIQEVTDLYESQDLTLTQELINKYKIEYVFIGELEKQKYPGLAEAKWLELGDIIYQQGETKIIKLLVSSPLPLPVSQSH